MPAQSPVTGGVERGPERAREKECAIFAKSNHDIAQEGLNPSWSHFLSAFCIRSHVFGRKLSKAFQRKIQIPWAGVLKGSPLSSTIQKAEAPAYPLNFEQHTIEH